MKLCIHEIMCPSDDSHLTIEFKDHYVIKPTILFSNKKNNFYKNKLGELGKDVKEGFEYNSSNNPKFLSISEIKNFDRDLNN